jgi:hypothetical protein
MDVFGRDTITYINKLYDLSFFDVHFQSILIILLFTFIVILGITANRIFSKSSTIKQNWEKERCKPNIMPFAGLINKPIGQTVAEYTLENFNYCLKNILNAGFKKASASHDIGLNTNMMMGSSYTTDMSFNRTFNLFGDIQKNVNDTFAGVKNKFANTLVPIQQSVYAMKDIFARMQAIFIAGVYTSLGNSLIIKSLTQQFLESVSKIFYLLLVVITALFIIPGTQSLAVATTAVTMPLLVATASINLTMGRALGVKPGKLPSIKKCFDKHTKLLMNNGEYKEISQLVVGDVLEDNNMVTATIILDSKHVKMYNVNDVIISGYHKIKYNDEWVSVSKYPYKIELLSYSEPVIYCINTQHKIIKANGNEFLDWDELYDKHLTKVLQYRSAVGTIGDKSNIHRVLDGGFCDNTPIKLASKQIVRIQDIRPGDKLIDGSTVYGVVNIKSDDVKSVCEYNLGQSRNTFRGGANLLFYDSSLALHTTLNINDILKNPSHSVLQLSNPGKRSLYHLLTDRRSFYVGNIKFADYNSLIDSILSNSI